METILFFTLVLACFVMAGSYFQSKQPFLGGFFACGGFWLLVYAAFVW